MSEVVQRHTETVAEDKEQDLSHRQAVLPVQAPYQKTEVVHMEFLES